MKRLIHTMLVLSAMLLLAVSLVALQCPEVACAGCAGDEEVVAKQGGMLAPPVVFGVVSLVFDHRGAGSCVSVALAQVPRPVDPALMWSRLII